MPVPRYLLIANPGTKRCDSYLRDLRAFWNERGESVDVTVVPWAGVASVEGSLDSLPAFDSPAIVRMESPGKDATALRMMLEVGARGVTDEPPQDWLSLPLPKGLLVRPGLWYRGFRRVLEGLHRSFTARPHLATTACPLAIAEMFDKSATARRLAAAGVPVPEMLEPLPKTAIELQARILASGWPTAYVKLNTGSAATGIVALSPRGDAGDSSVAPYQGQFYSTRRLRRLTRGDLHRTLDFLFCEGAIVQRGIPKAQIDGQNCDLRVVCIEGRPVASIFRLSANPMTNLHLGGRRGDFARCRAAIPTRAWLDALDRCAEAASCFQSTVAGVDLIFEPGYRQHYILEVNAFGDFFPGIREQGRTLPQIEIESTARRLGYL